MSIIKNTAEFLKKFYKEQLKITNGAKGDSIHQTQRNQIKRDLLAAIQADLASELDADALHTPDGIGIVIDNEEQGGVPLVLDIAMKSFEYDVFEQNDRYNENQLLKEEKRIAREKARKTKYKNDTAARALKESRK